MRAPSGCTKPDGPPSPIGSYDPAAEIHDGSRAIAIAIATAFRMIRYTLACESGHDFESWFPSSGAYDEQAARGLVTCPICNSRKVGKTLMAPAIARTDRGRAPRVPHPSPGPAEAPVPAPERHPVPMIAEPERRLRALLRAVREHVVATAEHVGPRFSEEARAMHLGETPVRPIYGEASLKEARALVEDGIEVAPLPPTPDDRH